MKIEVKQKTIFSLLGVLVFGIYYFTLYSVIKIDYTDDKEEPKMTLVPFDHSNMDLGTTSYAWRPKAIYLDIYENEWIHAERLESGIVKITIVKEPQK